MPLLGIVIHPFQLPAVIARLSILILSKTYPTKERLYL
jgi:hypothetical protein